MGAIVVTGCWEGALLSDQSGQTVPFSLQQSPPALGTSRGPYLSIGDNAAVPAQLLDGAAHAIVALVNAWRDPQTGTVGQWLVDARVHGDQMEGRWLRRDGHGQVLATGQLTAAKITNG